MCFFCPKTALFTSHKPAKHLHLTRLSVHKCKTETKLSTFNSQDPFLFHRIRASFTHPELPWEWDEPEAVCAFLEVYAEQAFGLRRGSSSDSQGENAMSTQGEFASHPSTMMTDRGKFGCMKKVGTAALILPSAPMLYCALSVNALTASSLTCLVHTTRSQPNADHTIPVPEES